MFVCSSLLLVNPRKTISAGISKESLEYINAVGSDDECTEKLCLHASLLLSQLSALTDLDTFHKSMPWNAAVALDKSLLPDLLKRMQQEWDFVKSVVDTLDSKGNVLHDFLRHTRWQPYRDLFTKAESLEAAGITPKLFYSNVYIRQYTSRTTGLYTQVGQDILWQCPGSNHWVCPRSLVVG